MLHRVHRLLLLAGLCGALEGGAQAQQVEVISRAAFPIAGGGGSAADISDDGRYVVFTSSAANLVAGQVDDNRDTDVFLHDRVSDAVTLVSHTASPTVAGNGTSDVAVISGDGAFVAFASEASDLGVGIVDANGAYDVFLYEVATGEITLVSHTSSAVDAGNGRATEPSISGDGGYVAFGSRATNLGTGLTDVNGSVDDVFLFERSTGGISLVSHSSTPTTSASDYSIQPVVSADGSCVVFGSRAGDVGPGFTDANSGYDVFVYDRASTAITLVSHGASLTTTGNGESWPGLASVSADGAWIVLSSRATDLGGGGFSFPISGTDVFVYERSTGAITLASHTADPTTAGNDYSYTPSISAEGGHVVFESLASDIGGPSTDSGFTEDVFLYERASGIVSLVSHTASATTSGNGFSGNPSVSDDGRYVVFDSAATDLGVGLSDGNWEGDAFWYESATGTIGLASRSLSSAVAAGDRGSTGPLVSGDGTAVVFSSFATDLVAEVDGPNQDVFVFDTTAGTVSLASPGGSGIPSATADGFSYAEDVSDDGRFTVFTSGSVNLVPGQDDQNRTNDVFLYDRLTGAVALVSHAAGATEAADGLSRSPTITGDGEYVVFQSQASNLGTGVTDANGTWDVYLFERATGNLTLVSHAASPTTAAAGASEWAVVSRDGSAVVFQSSAQDLGSGYTDANGFGVDVFVYDVGSGVISLASHTASTSTTGNGISRFPVISGNGSYVAFISYATDLGPGFTEGNGSSDVFLYERSTGAISLVSHTASATVTGNSTSSAPDLSWDGAYVVFLSGASNLGNVALVDTNSGDDVFVYERATGVVQLVSHTDSATTAGNGWSSASKISADGAFVVFLSRADDLRPSFTDGNSSDDAFLYERSTGALSLVSHTASLTTTANWGASSPRVSADGGRVAFLANSTDLGPGFTDANGTMNDAFLYERATGSISLVSHTQSSPTTSADSPTVTLRISADGNHVAFNTEARDIVEQDFNDTRDAFLYSTGCEPAALTASPAGANQIELSWTSPGAYTHRVLRSRSSGGPYEEVGTVLGVSYTDTTVHGGVTYYYVVSNGCGSSNEASASTTGTCLLPPDFDGLAGASQDLGGDCGAELTWDPASEVCGTGVSYAVYRGAWSGFPLDETTRIAEGLTATSYHDAAGLAQGATYYYVVRARSLANAEWDANQAEQSILLAAACVDSAPAAVSFFNVRSGDGQNVLNWVNPVAGFGFAEIRYDTSGYPSLPSDGSPAATSAGGPGDVESFVHAVANGVTYYYTAFVNGPTGWETVGKGSFGRAADDSGPVKWGYATGASSLATTGVMPSVSYHGVSNDRVVHAMLPGELGGMWPAGWRPLAMSGPSQGRPTVVRLPTTTVMGASRVGLVGSQDGRVYAFDAESGALLWASAVLGERVQAAPAAMFRDYGGAYDLVLVGTRNSTDCNVFYGLHLADGTEAWRFDNGGCDIPPDPEAMGLISGQARVDYATNRVYFTSHQHATGSPDSVWALSFSDTAAVKLWSKDVSEDVEASPTLAGGVLYVGTVGGLVHALDPESSGADIWAIPYTTGDGGVKSLVWPDLASGVAYASSNGLVHAINLSDGSPFWAPVSVSNVSAPLLAGGRLYVGGADSRLHELDALTGAETAGSPAILGDALVPKVVGRGTLDVSGGILTVGTDEGVIYGVAIPFPPP